MASTMLFRDWLEANGINPRETLIMRHRPKELKLRRNFPSEVLGNPRLFNSFQRSHFPRQEQQLRKKRYLASFWGHAPGKALFVGLFENDGSPASISLDEYRNIPDNRRLMELGMSEPESSRQSMLWFNLNRVRKFDRFRDKLVIQWIGGERNWSRMADGRKNAFPIIDGVGTIGKTRAAFKRHFDSSTGRATAAAARKAYLKYVSQYEATIRPGHDRLQKRFEEFLAANALKFGRNLNFVDLQYTDSDRGLVLVEVKPCERSNARFAIRTAIGQLLDYRQSARKIAKMLIVVGGQPRRKDRELATSSGFGIAYPLRRSFTIDVPGAQT